MVILMLQDCRSSQPQIEKKLSYEQELWEIKLLYISDLILTSAQSN